VAGSYEHGNKSSGFIRDGQFVWQLSNFLRKDCSMEVVEI